MIKARPLSERFWSHVHRNGPPPEHCPELGNCWLWVGAKYNDGYGSFAVAWRPSKNVAAHRKSYELTVGPIPAGFQVLHACDNRPCVRPDHLFLGTQSDNIQDMVTKGRAKHVECTAEFKARYLNGERNVRAKLTRNAVRQIQVLYAAGGVTQFALAAQFGISEVTVGRIIRGLTWRHLLPEDGIGQ